MKQLLAIMLFVTLTGCSTVTSYIFPAKYDTNEYELINWIRTAAELSIETCDDYDLTKHNMVTLYRGSLEFKNYTQYQRKNQDTYKLASDLFTMIDNSVQVYADNVSVSQLFCELSLEQINETAETIQKALGDKPR
jgi:hypothetical protein